MATISMGAFGAYKLAYSRHRAEIEKMEQEAERIQQEGEPENNHTVWVIKRYIPTDLRVTAPVPRHKLTPPDARNEIAPEHWIPPIDLHPRFHSRSHEEKAIYASTPSTRSQEWSTLRQMLPSSGRARRIVPPNWGTGFAKPPSMVGDRETKFVHINSPMTRYVDNMHTTHKLFRLY